MTRVRVIRGYLQVYPWEYLRVTDLDALASVFPRIRQGCGVSSLITQVIRGYLQVIVIYNA